MALILVTDDDRPCRDTIQKTLEREGHVVEGAVDVDGALRAIDRSDFDLIVCDYRMPGKTGLDLLATLRSRSSRIPLVMLSGNADIATESAAAGLGVSAFLRKPLKRRDLLDSVEAAIAAGIPA